MQRSATFRLLGGSIALFLAGDAAWAVINRAGWTTMLVVTRMAQLLRHVESQAAKLKALATVDELTGLPNRRAWTSELPLAIERARRSEQSLAVALIDLDHFKRFNDAFGHLAGDRLLKACAGAWRERLRAGDLLARYGGEESILLLPGAEASDAEGLLARLRDCMPEGQTFSAGLVTWDTAARRSSSPRPTAPCTRPRQRGATASSWPPPDPLAMSPLGARGSSRRSMRGEDRGRCAIARLRFA